jgi:hypothetical protein
MKTLLKIYLIFICSLGSLALNGQDISGEWNGVMTQPVGGIAGQYYFSLHLKQEGTKITGFSKVELYEGDKRTMYARKSLIGEFDGKNLLFKEIEILEQKMSFSTNLCLVQAKLAFVFDKGSLCLIGTWGGKTKDDGACSPGKIKVCSTIPIAGLE